MIAALGSGFAVGFVVSLVAGITVGLARTLDQPSQAPPPHPACLPAPATLVTEPAGCSQPGSPPDGSPSLMGSPAQAQPSSTGSDVRFRGFYLGSEQGKHPHDHGVAPATRRGGARWAGQP